MKRMITLTLAVVLAIAAFSGCSKGKEEQPLTSEERTSLYQTAIENARDAESNEYVPVITSAEDESAPLILDLLGLQDTDMAVFGIAASPVNIKAYGIAAVMPAAGKEDAVLEGLNGFIDRQKQNFQQYLADQYEIASNARLETLEDGTILLVMCEDQDAVFDAIKDAIEAAQS